MSMKRRIEQVSVETAFAAPIAPLGMADLALVQRAMAKITPDWAVALAGTSTEEATLVVVPDDGDDRAGPSFVISRETYGIRVDQVHWDAVTEVGVYASLRDAVDVLRLRVAFCLDRTVPGSVTLH
jgi:hypothetical protein